MELKRYLVLALVACTPPPRAPAETRLHLAPCTIAGAAARCGTFDVRESATKTIALRVAVLPATERDDSPVVPMLGGPGVPTVDGAAVEVTELAAERRRHDVLFVDERGTGGSAPLACPGAMAKYEHALVEDDLFPGGFVTACRREVEATADPRAYTQAQYVDDIDELRAALGYDKLDIAAESYGARAGLLYLARHPASVRALQLSSPLIPADVAPLWFARDYQRALDRLADDCKCSLRDDLATLATVLDRAPAIVESGGYRIAMTRGKFAEFLRTLMYSVQTQALVPSVVHAAAIGTWDAIAPKYVAYRKRWYDNVPLFLSIACPSDVRWIDDAQIAAATANTFLGDYRVRREIAACADWTPGKDRALDVATLARVPTLITVGDLDPVTPPSWGEALAKQLPHARLVEFRASGHVEPTACAIGLEIAFFDAGSTDQLDDRCARELVRPP